MKRLISRYNFHVKQSANLTSKSYRKLLSHLNNASKVALSVYETVAAGLIMASFGFFWFGNFDKVYAMILLRNIGENSRDIRLHGALLRIFRNGSSHKRYCKSKFIFPTLTRTAALKHRI